MSRTRAKTPKGVLRAAARYIEEHGWYQGDYAAPDGAVCALGAINVVVTGSPYDLGDGVDRDLTLAAANVIENRLGSIGPISWWNDAPGRTKDEVLAVLRG